MGKVSWLVLSWKVLEFCSLEFLELVCWLWDLLCQDRLLISETMEKNYVGSKELLEGTLWHQGFGCNLHFHLIWYNNMFLSHKTSLVLLYDSLITYIGSCWVYCISFTLVGLCSLVGSISQEHWNRARMTMSRGNNILKVRCLSLVS